MSRETKHLYFQVEELYRFNIRYYAVGLYYNSMKKTLGIVGLYALPFVVFAQSGEQVDSIISQIQNILSNLIPLFITLALIYFIYGVAKFVTAKEASEKETARDVMIYGAIGLFVIVSIWGIVGLLQSFTGVGGGGAITPPTINTL